MTNVTVTKIDPTPEMVVAPMYVTRIRIGKVHNNPDAAALALFVEGRPDDEHFVFIIHREAVLHLAEGIMRGFTS